MPNKPALVGALLLLCALCVAVDARAQQPAAAPSSAGAFCDARQWSLDGASARADEAGEAALPATWLPQLDQIASCLQEPAAARACLEVEGRHDDRLFPPEVVRAFGGQEAAQAARARGRATLALQELRGRGVPADRLREVPPPAGPSFRGVSIRLVPDCLPAAAQLSDEDRRLLDEARALIEEKKATPPPPPPAPPQQQPEPQQSRLQGFADVSLHGSLATADSATVASPGLRLAAGAKAGWLAARIGVGAATSNREAQQNALEAFVAAEFHVLPWLSVGPVAGLRFGAPATDAPWLERSFHAGFEAAQHLLTFGENNHLLLQQAVLPFASQERRGEIGNGRLERIPPTSESMVRFELGLSLRHDL